MQSLDGRKAKFTYPDFGTPVGYPDHVAHSGQVVTIIRQLYKSECEPECQPTFKIKADDGWIGEAHRSELRVQRSNTKDWFKEHARLPRKIKAFSHLRQELFRVRQLLFPANTVVLVACPQYHGEAIVSHNNEDVRPDQLACLLENGNVWWYPLDTITLLEDRKKWPLWIVRVFRRQAAYKGRVTKMNNMHRKVGNELRSQNH